MKHPRPVRGTVDPTIHSFEEMWREPEPFLPSRRQYPKWEASAGGATEDVLTTTTRRRLARCSEPSCTGIVRSAPSTPSEKHRSIDKDNDLIRQQPTPMGPSRRPARGRRHVRPSAPDNVQGGSAPQVEARVEARGRRHCSLGANIRGAAGYRSRPQSVPQRRHITPQDHIEGCAAICPSEAGCETRPGETVTLHRVRREDNLFGPTIMSGGPADIPPTMPVPRSRPLSEAAAADAAGKRPFTERGMRHCGPAEHLIGGTLWCPSPSPATTPIQAQTPDLLVEAF